MSNISESVFQAIDTIVKKRLSELSFDLTIVCEIIDDTNADLGKYRVKQGTTYFDAYNEDITFSIGDKVNVLIPQNDYSLKKIILNKYVSDKENNNIQYIPTKNNLYFCSDNLYKLNNFINLPTDIYYDTIYITAECGLSSLIKDKIIKLTDADYGYQLDISYDLNISKIEYLNCDKMLGDVCNLDLTFEQTFIISVKDLINIKSISFKDYNNYYKGYIDNGNLQDIPNGYIQMIFNIKNIYLCQSLENYQYEPAVWAYLNNNSINFFWYLLINDTYQGFVNKNQLENYNEKEYYKLLQKYKELLKINLDIFIPNKLPPQLSKLENYYDFILDIKSLLKINSDLKKYLIEITLLVENETSYRNTIRNYYDNISFFSLDALQNNDYVWLIYYEIYDTQQSLDVEFLKEISNKISSYIYSCLTAIKDWNLSSFNQKEYYIAALKSIYKLWKQSSSCFEGKTIPNNLITLNTAYTNFIEQNKNQYAIYLFTTEDSTILNNEDNWQDYLNDKNSYYIQTVVANNFSHRYRFEKNSNKEYGPTAIPINNNTANYMGIVIVYNHLPYFSNVIKIK